MCKIISECLSEKGNIPVINQNNQSGQRTQLQLSINCFPSNGEKYGLKK